MTSEEKEKLTGFIEVIPTLYGKIHQKLINTKEFEYLGNLGRPNIVELSVPLKVEVEEMLICYSKDSYLNFPCFMTLLSTLGATMKYMIMHSNDLVRAQRVLLQRQIKVSILEEDFKSISELYENIVFKLSRFEKSIESDNTRKSRMEVQ